jgi:hypothetical protein
MDDQRHIDLRELRRRVAAGEYQVDPRAVADAIVRRGWVLAGALQPGPVVPIATHRSTRARCDGARTEEHARAA